MADTSLVYRTEVPRTRFGLGTPTEASLHEEHTSSVPTTGQESVTAQNAPHFFSKLLSQMIRAELISAVRIPMP